MDAIRKRFVKSVGVPFANLLEKFGFDTKSMYEFSYWRYQKLRERTLNHDHYEPLFTKWVDLDREFYRDKIILDIGCGPRGSLEWADHSSSRIGLDPLVSQYRKLGIDDHAMDYVDSPAESMPFASDYFDIVTSFNSLDHVDSPDTVVNEVLRVLKPGGVFVVVVEIHSEPTIAEPIVLDWSFLNAHKNDFETVEQFRYKFNPAHPGAIAALQSRIPASENELEGVVFAKLWKGVK